MDKITIANWERRKLLDLIAYKTGRLDATGLIIYARYLATRAINALAADEIADWYTLLKADLVEE